MASRRDFLKKGSLVALAAGVPLGFAEKVAEASVPNWSAPAGLSLRDFRNQLNSQFLVRKGNRKVAVKLVNVKDLRHQSNLKHGGECFGLQFRGDRGNLLKQDTYVMEHQKLGSFSFLIVPMKMESVPYYEAIINRLHS